MTKYLDFIKRKATSDPATGLSVVPALNPMLHQHQADMVRWALHRGRAAIFADCGLGKGPMQMEWATKQPHEALIVAPLAVAHQFVREAEKFGIDLAYAKAARENDDERHVCPMALDLIERAIQLWSNPGDVVFDPFSGVGSTGYQAIRMGRKFAGSELKTAYFEQAVKNIGSAKANQGALFESEAA